MHPAVLLFVLLFIPNTNLDDWQSAPAPALHELMSHGALALMNARTAERDQISTDAGINTIFAGARLYSSYKAGHINYPANPDNLLDALINGGVGVSPQPKVPQLDLPFYMPPPTRHFISAELRGSWEEIDQQVAGFANLVRSNRGILMIVSPNPSKSEYAAEQQLTPVLLWGQGMPSSYLQSTSTRNLGLITNTDIAPTIAAVMSLTLPEQPFGSAATVQRTNDDKVTVLLQRESAWTGQAIALRFIPYIAAAIALMILIVINLRLGSQSVAAGIVAVATMIPLVLLLSTSAWLFAGLLLIGLIISLKALMPDDAAPFAALTVIIMISIDAFIFGGRLTGGSMLGYSPIEGARYYGIGNEVMGAYVGALAVITGLWDWKGEHRTPITILWLIAALALGLPETGAKAGGLIVCLTTLAAYVVVGGGKKLYDIRTIAAVIAAFAISIGILVFLGHIGPKTHVTDALTLAKSSGVGTIFQTVERKIDMDVYLVFHSIWIWVLLLTSYGRWTIRQDNVLSKVGTVAVLACLLFNDAGVVAAAICSLTLWTAEFNRDKGVATNKKATLTVVESA